MSDPIDETLDHLGRHVGCVGQTITSEVARQVQRANDERRRTMLDVQRKAERDQKPSISSETPTTTNPAATGGIAGAETTAPAPSTATQRKSKMTRVWSADLPVASAS